MAFCVNSLTKSSRRISTSLIFFIGKRLIEVRQYLGINQSQMSNIIGVSQASLSKFEKNQNNISDEAKSKIFSMGISLDWLITGEGEMLRQSVESIDKKDR